MSVIRERIREQELAEYNDRVKLEKFLAEFSTEEACAEYLVKAKWPNGYRCPRCRHRHAYVTTTRRLPLYECSRCRHQTSLIADTVMHGSRTALRKWLLAIFLVSLTARGISATKLKETIQVTYKTAWLMLHKIRAAMAEADSSVLLCGLVRAHDATYARPYFAPLYTHPQENLLLVGASMNEHNQPTYIKMKLVNKQFVNQYRTIRREATELFSEKHVSADPGTQAEFVTLPFKTRRVKPLYPFFYQAEKWMTRTFRGLGPRHLQVYFDEFCYRLNQIFDQQPIFEKLSQLCTLVKATTYPNLIKRVYPSQEETGGHYTNNMDGYVPWFLRKRKRGGLLEYGA